MSDLEKEMYELAKECSKCVHSDDDCGDCDHPDINPLSSCFTECINNFYEKWEQR